MLEIAIIGAGPYGLSLAAYFRNEGIPFRIFGRPMDSWVAHMPKGMMLKSDGFASNIYDPDDEYTLKKFCTERQIEYSDAQIPVRLDTFSSYGLAFKERMVRELEEKVVTDIERKPDGFLLRLDDGETLTARRVVLAVGITHFEYLPAELADLSPEFLSHSFRHHDLESFRGRNVAVLGGGSSAIDLAILLHESGAEVQLVARQKALKFHGAPDGRRRSLWKRIRHPQSGIGPGLKARFYADAPHLFHHLPEAVRLKLVKTALGPSGGWFTKEKIVGRVPLMLGCAVQRAEVKSCNVHLHLRAANGAQREIVTEHVIAATGYKVDMERLTFLSGEIRSKIKALEGTPVLSSNFESSVPGLYFVGIAAANSFGPVMRFAFGAGFAARNLTRTMVRSISKRRASVPAASVATATK